MKNIAGCLLACAMMLLLSQVTGDYLLKNSKLGQKKFARASLGFFAFLALYQILILPAQLFHLPTIWLPCAFVLESLAVLLLQRKRFVSLAKESWKELTAAALVGCIAVVLSLMYTDSLVVNGLADHWFYIKFIRENADLSSVVNLYNPVKGMDTGVQNIYAFSGLFHLYSGLSSLFRVDPLFFTLWFGTWMMHTVTGAVHFFLLSWFKGNKWIKFVVLLSLIDAFTGLNIEYGYLPTYFRTATGSTMLVILLLAHYVQTEDRFVLKLALMMNVSLMACQSTHFFISVALTLALCIYEIIFKKNRSVPYFTMLAIPCLIYAFSLLVYEGRILLAGAMLGGFCLLNAAYFVIKDWKGYPILVYSVLILLLSINGLAFVLTDPTVSLKEAISQFGSLYLFNGNLLTLSGWNTLAKVASRWLVIVFAGLAAVHHSELNSGQRFIVVLLIVLFMYFYNPFAVVGVSTFLTGEVYTRFTSISGSFAVVFAALGFFFQYRKFRILGLCMIVSLGFISSVRMISEVKHAQMIDLSDVNRQMLMYRLDDEMMDLGMFLKQYSEERLSIVYPKTINRFMLIADHVVSSDIMPSFSQMRYDAEINFNDWTANPLRNQLQVFLMAPELYFTDYYYQFDSERVPDIEKMLTVSNTDIFVLKKWDSDESNQKFRQHLEAFSYMIYETEHYEVFRIYR